MSESVARIDGALGRAIAGVVFLGVLAALAWIHWADVFPPPEADAAANPALAACMEARLGDIEKMLQDGVIDDTQAQQFKSRATALCESATEEGQLPEGLR